MLPIWTFHAEDDGVVPVAGTREIVAALKTAGSTVKYTEYPKAMGINHGSWVPAGKNPELVKWVFSQAKATVSLAPKEVLNPGKRTVPRNGKMAPDHIDALGKIHPKENPSKNVFYRPEP
jgi:dienelactone hydrolase